MPSVPYGPALAPVAVPVPGEDHLPHALPAPGLFGLADHALGNQFAVLAAATGTGCFRAPPAKYLGTGVSVRHLEIGPGAVTVYHDDSRQFEKGCVDGAFFPRLSDAYSTILIDCGTRALTRIDLTAPSNETSIRRLVIDTNTRVREFSRSTRMRRIIDLAPLSLRLWAAVFKVSHSSISKWTALDPERPELTVALELLERAARRHSDLESWLQAPVGSTSLTPLELLTDGRWRAFAGAIGTAAAPAPELDAAVLRALRRGGLPWAIQDTPGIPVQA
jgi:hypothetical protein